MFAPQKSVNLTFFQRFVDYNWPTRKRTFRHILSFLSQLSVGPSLCRSRSSRASSEVSFRYIPKLRKLALNQEATRPEKGMCQLYKLRNFADAGLSRRAGCQRRIISSLEGTARATLSTALLPTTLQAIPESHFVLHNVVVVARTENDMSHARPVSRRFTTGLGYCKNDLQSTIQQVNEIG